MSDAKRPTPRERVDRAAAAVRPAVDKARAKAEPTVEKAAARAGSLFGQLRERAKETAKNFGEGYKGDEQAEQAEQAEQPATPATEQPLTGASAEQPRRPRPGPGK